MATKRQQGTAKASITKILNQIHTASDEAAMEMISSLNNAVQNFEEIHKSYHSSLEDEDDIDSSEIYYKSVMRGVQDVKDMVAAKKVKQKVMPASASDAACAMQQQMLFA